MARLLQGKRARSTRRIDFAPSMVSQEQDPQARRSPSPQNRRRHPSPNLGPTRRAPADGAGAHVEEAPRQPRRQPRKPAGECAPPSRSAKPRPRPEERPEKPARAREDAGRTTEPRRRAARARPAAAPRPAARRCRPRSASCSSRSTSASSASPSSRTTASPRSTSSGPRRRSIAGNIYKGVVDNVLPGHGGRVRRDRPREERLPVRRRDRRPELEGRSGTAARSRI